MTGLRPERILFRFYRVEGLEVLGPLEGSSPA